MQSKSFIIFPLLILFMLALVNFPFDFDESVGDSFIILRNINETTLTYITTQTEIIYDNTTSVFWWVHKSDFSLEYALMLNDVFGFSEGHYNQAEDIYDLRSAKGSPLINTEIYEVIKYDPNLIQEIGELSGFGLSLGNPNMLFIGMFLGAIVIAVILGIRLFGSGISETSIGIVYKLLILFLLWGLLSTLTYDLFVEIPNSYGLIIWLVLTFIYSIGGLLYTFSSGD